MNIQMPTKIDVKHNGEAEIDFEHRDEEFGWAQRGVLGGKLPVSVYNQ